MWTLCLFVFIRLFLIMHEGKLRNRYRLLNINLSWWHDAHERPKLDYLRNDVQHRKGKDPIPYPGVKFHT